MDLKVCEYFLTIIEEGSMNKAAKVLHITQPTLSRQIAQLESELNVLLFERQAKALYLTSEGLLFARRAREMLQLEEKAFQEIHTLHEDLQGEITFGSGELAATSELLKLAAQFQKKHPKVQISILTGTADQTREMIENGLIDFGLFLKPIQLKGVKVIAWPGTECFCAIMPKDHPLALKKSITPQDLKKESLILPYRREPGDMVEKWLGKENDSFHISGYSSLSTNGSLMALQGLGILLSIEGAPAHFHSELVTRPLNPPLESAVVLAWKERFPQSPIQNEFLKFLKEKFPKNTSFELETNNSNNSF